MKSKRIASSLIFFVLLLVSCKPPPAAATQAPVPSVEPTLIPSPIPTSIPASTQTVIPTSTPTPSPIIALNKGDFYFNIDGQQSFIFSRNLAGYEPSQFSQLLDWTSPGGSKIVRLQLDCLGMGYSNSGQVDEAWAKKWEDIFDMAAIRGIYVMPVFGVWYDWNDGKGYSTWKDNPLNAINGGQAKSSGELFVSDSSTQKNWFNWMKMLVERWQDRKNIIAWEIFSEVNMAPGTTESKAIDFVNAAASIIRNADTFQRPVTASLADFGDWSGFFRNDAIDFINIHPYPVPGNLDMTIISEVRTMLDKYHKPVLIGESGLSFQTPDSYPITLTVRDRAYVGIKHAIWAAVVSGAMNGRSLWWEDGVAIYFPSLSLPFIKKYANAELPAANFVKDVDFSNFQPLVSRTDSGVMGAAIGSEKMVLGWYRDAGSEPPAWKEQPVLSKQKVNLTVPGASSNWTIDFYDTKTGTTVTSSANVVQKGNKVTINLPDFSGDIAFKMKAQN